MFIDKLSSQQQAALLSAAEQLIGSDQNIADQETAFLQILRSQMDPGIESVPFLISDFPVMFTTKPTKVAFLLELLGVAHADSEYHVAEKDLIHALATALDIPALLLADMEDWVCRQLELVREAVKFMEE